METLKIGLIATGGRGRHGWEAHQPDKGVIITAGCDIDPEAQAKFHEDFPEAQLFDDYREEISAILGKAVF